MKASHHYLTSILLSICTLLCMLPAPASAQLFGGMIKSKNGPLVIPGIIPANLTMGTSNPYFVASVYDQDYLPYTNPTGTGTAVTQAADGINEAFTVNVQGTITTTGVTVSLPATATGSGTLPAYTITVTVPSTMTQDGISRDLTLSWASTGYNTSTTSITATLKAVGGTLNVKKLDINAGIGNDAQGVLLAQLVYPKTSTGTTTTFAVRGIAGIPDKMFGKYDLARPTTLMHQCLYVPVKGEDGKIWLNNNLGAQYSKINSSMFSPGKQAQSPNDNNASGFLFQWGRGPDGHEYNDFRTYSCTDGPAPEFMMARPNGDWRCNSNESLWAAESSTNNPCPKGFRVPTSSELANYISAAGITNVTTASTKALHLVSPSYHPYDATGIQSATWISFIWSSTGDVMDGNKTRAKFLCLDGSIATISYAGLYGGVYRGFGLGVRCIQN